MYNSVRISEFDQHCHHFLWKSMNTTIAPNIYAITAVNIGVRLSGTIATVALRKTAKLEKENYPTEAKIIQESSYVDDIIDSTETIEKAMPLTGNITGILLKGNFVMKQWILSDHENRECDLTGESSERVLGIRWMPKDDVLCFNVRLNFSCIKNGQRVKPDLTINDIPDKIPLELTKRNMMSQLNGIYDPIGLLTPFTVKGKIIMRNIWMSQSDWDDVLPRSIHNECLEFFQEMLQIPVVTFKRCVKPEGAIGHPTLVIFSDASEQAIGCCAYVVWKTNKSRKAMLLTSKWEIAPLKVISIVRLELSAAVLAKRIRATITKYCRWKFDRILHIVDSEIVRAMINKESYGFNTFVAIRIGEIHSETNPSDWFWTDTKNNIADMLTKGAQPHHLSSSLWQCGPDFLTLPFECWPITQHSSISDIPERKTVVITVCTDVKNDININRFSNYQK